MATHFRPPELDEDTCLNIFTASAALMGVCLTVIGIIRLVIATNNITTVADDLLVIDTLVFFASCLLSYWALRARSAGRMRRVERTADLLFVVGLMLMAAVCGIITYGIA
jgi:hypothetical protein